MARKRMLSPEFFTSRTLNDLPIPCMVTFEGFWCHADDAGRGDDDEVMVKSTVWPRRKAITEAKVREHLDMLTRSGVLCRYVVNGFALLHVVAWTEHQKISHPTPSKLPPCPTHDADLWDLFLNSPDPALAKFLDSSRSAHGGLTEDDLRTHPQSSSVEVSSTKSKSRTPRTSQPDGDLGLVSNG